MKKLTYITGAVFALTIMILAAQPAVAQDPVAVDAKHYKVEFENAHVRVLRIQYGVKEKSVMHKHPEGVAIFLSDMRGNFKLADGKKEERSMKAGQVRWTPGETHLPENLGGKHELILVELKDQSGLGAMPDAADDAIKVAAKHHKVEFENDRVRVVRGTVGARAKTEMHGHPANIVIALTDISTRSFAADGKNSDLQIKAGQVMWREPTKHLSENLGDKPFEVIIVELKGK
ncbi:MAG: hypothetical protein ACKVRN_04450 [Pyrinomonadaceae bacterium]